MLRAVSLTALAVLPGSLAFMPPAPPGAMAASREPLTRVYSWEDEDADVRYTMSPRHIDTGFLKREKAAPLYEDASLLTAETLNEIFAPDEKENIFLLRSMWTASCIFRLDGILVDSADLQARAWEKVAESVDAPAPSMKQVFAAMHVAPEEAVGPAVFNWANDADEARAMAETFDAAIKEEVQAADLHPIQGALELVEDMLESEIPCAVVSNLPLEAIETTLTRIGLRDMIECIETFDNHLKTEAHLLLNACLEMERPPRHAVVFDFSAQGVDTAHDNDMRAVVLDGLYYQELEVNQCDAKLTRLTDWTLPRFRQLVERYPFDEQYQTVTAMSASRAPVKRKVSVATYDSYKYEKLPDGTVAPTKEYLATEQRRKEVRDRRRQGKGLPEGSRFYTRGGDGDGAGAGEDVEE